MREKTSLFMIDGGQMLVPDGDMVTVFADLDGEDTGRDESGCLHRFRKREGIRKWEFSYTDLLTDEYAYLKGLLAGKETFVFTFPEVENYFSPGTVQAYCTETQMQIESAMSGMVRHYRFVIQEV